MTFDNERTLIRLRLRVLIASVLMIVYVFFALVEVKIPFPLLGLSDTTWTVILVVGYFLLSFYPMIFRYKYFNFSDDGPKIVLRYYSVGLVRGKLNSIEIPKSDFRGYEKGKTLAGLMGTLVLKQTIRNKTASYPGVYITSLSRTEKKKIFDTLDKYSG